MAILNYTTTVSAFRTSNEIEEILVKHKAKSIMKNYEGESITGLSFLIDTGVQQIPIRLPVKVDECLKVLKKEKRENPRKQIKDTREQAEQYGEGFTAEQIYVDMLYKIVDAPTRIHMIMSARMLIPVIDKKLREGGGE